MMIVEFYCVVGKFQKLFDPKKHRHSKDFLRYSGKISHRGIRTYISLGLPERKGTSSKN